MAHTSNILDPIHAELPGSLWDKPESAHPKLKAQHGKWITSNVKHILEKAGYTHMDEWLSLVLTGSLTTYQYSDDSDVDISLFVDAEVFPEWSRAEMIGIMVDQMDGVILPGTGYPMQCFVVPSDITREDLYKPGLRSGYDIETDKWIEPPDPTRTHDVEKEMNASYVFALESADKMERLLRYEPDTAIQYWHQIHKRRRREHKAGKGDFSQANIVYKFLSQRKLFPKISEISGEYIAHTAAQWLPNEEDVEDYTTGQCAAFAVAHQDAHPHLQFGIDWEKLSDKESEKEAVENGEDWDGGPAYLPQHIFTHDDKHAYDVEGKHPLPYQNWDKLTLNHSKQDIVDTGYLEEGYMPDRNWILQKAPKVTAGKIVEFPEGYEPYEEWEPGDYGKGLFIPKQDRLVLWKVEEVYDPSDEYYHHYEMLHALRLDMHDAVLLTAIYRDGTFDCPEKSRREEILDLDSRLLPEAKSGWTFGKQSTDINHQQVLDANRGQNLQGLPGPVNVPNLGPLQFHSNDHIQKMSQDYNRQHGIQSEHPSDYLKVNPQHGAKIAQAYEQMEHKPHDPQVKASYGALASETKAQYDHAVKNGYQFEFYPDHDPYPNSPREAVLDLHHNKRMYVYPTESGYGSGEEEYPDHPLLEDSGVQWNGRKVTHNDLFRAVHDMYGHAKEGVGFRPDGEDNAYRQHAAMFTPLARKALTAETRGQNSFVNYGPNGEHNQTAKQGDTIFAPQKAGLLPDWVEDPNLHYDLSSER